MTEWIEETLHPDFRFRMRVDRVLFEGRSENQHVAVVDNGTFGRTLYLDGVLQTSERDEFIYHEMLTHVPILAHGEVRDLLIIGGGDGGMLEETLKHRTIERATMVEIDPRWSRCAASISLRSRTAPSTTRAPICCSRTGSTS